MTVQTTTDQLAEPPIAIRSIGGVTILVATRSRAIECLDRAIRDRTPSIWGFCNAHTVNCARTIAGYRAVLSRVQLFNDGIGLNIASRILYGHGFPENLNGTDFTPALLAGFTQPTAIFLIGSAPGVAERAGEALSERFPNVRIVGAQHGFFRTDEEAGVARRIAASKAQLVVVGMGNPMQEQWAVRHINAIAAPLLCIGAFLDFSAGVVHRAPEIVRKLRIEWLYRLAQEPRRLARRYIVGNATFLAAILSEKVAQR